MTISQSESIEIIYPESDGTPMAESDATRDYLTYSVEALSMYFQSRADVYVSGNLFIYYQQGIPSAVVAPDVFVVFGVANYKRRTYKVWEEKLVPSFVLEVTSFTTQKNDEEEKPKKYAALGVAEYFQYDPTGDYLQPQIKGSRLVGGKYQPIVRKELAEKEVSILSEVLGLELRLQAGELRFYEPETQKRLLSYQEQAQARQQAELAQQQAELARQQEVQARQQAELAQQQEVQARQQAELAQRNAVPRLLALGLSVEQVAEALSLSVKQVQQLVQESPPQP